MSDVPGDRPLDIASGPTCADPTTCADALDIAQRYGIALPEAALDALRSGRAESVKPGDPRLARAEIRMAATPQMALEAAAAVARQAGYDAHILGDALEARRATSARCSPASRCRPPSANSRSARPACCRAAKPP